MTKDIASALKQLIAQYGVDLRKDLRRLEGLLRDFGGQNRGQINMLMLAAREGIANTIHDHKESKIDALTLSTRAIPSQNAHQPAQSNHRIHVWVATVFILGLFLWLAPNCQASDWKLSQVLEAHSDGVYGVAFSPDGKRLASGSGDKTIQLWRVADGEPLQVLEAHSDEVYGVAFSPNGELLASGSLDKTIQLWRVADGEPLRTLMGHKFAVESVAFSPDGELLASGSWDNTIRLWRVADGEPLRTLKGHGHSVLSVAFSPDGKLLASGSVDKTIRLWKRSQ